MTIRRPNRFLPFTSLFLVLGAAMPLVIGRSAAAAGRDFYVSPAGDDANAGSESGWRFFSLYVDGESRTRARTPNWGQKVLRAEGAGAGDRQQLHPPAGDRLA